MPKALNDDQIQALTVLVRYHLRNGFDTPDKLLKLCGIEPYQRKRGGEVQTKEYSRIFTRFVDGAPQHAAAIAAGFRKTILTARYGEKLPLYVIHAIHEVFPDIAHKGFLKDRLEQSKTRTSPLLLHYRFASYDENRINQLKNSYCGLWDAIRYNHLGIRVVRVVLEISPPDENNTTHPFPTFTIHFRTRDHASE